jgi:hypothetical protein
MTSGFVRHVLVEPQANQDQGAKRDTNGHITGGNLSCSLNGAPLDLWPKTDERWRNGQKNQQRAEAETETQ